MSGFTPLPVTEIKDGYFYGHQIKTAHVKGTNTYRVNLDGQYIGILDAQGFYELLVSLKPLEMLT